MNCCFSFSVVFVLTNYAYTLSAEENNFKLELLQALFRHGDRSAARKEIYNDDPYDDVYKQIGYGQLTKVGKEREYEIGQILRSRYDDFLGEFKFDEVYAYSTDYDRTKMSLNLVLAGLYPPTNNTTWSNAIPWSPIPTHYNSTRNCIYKSFEECPRYKELLAEVENSPEIQAKREQYVSLLKRVQNVTGIKNITSSTIFYLRNNLRSALGLGLPLPAWCSEEDYVKLMEVSRIMYVTQAYTEKLARITAGPAIERFLSNIADHERSEVKRKIYVNCAHDNNIATFNIVHKFANVPDLPDYGSMLVVEKLRGRDGQIYLRMFMWTGVTGEWIALKMPSCDAACPLKRYVSLLEWAFPDDETRKCVNYVPTCK